MSLLRQKQYKNIIFLPLLIILNMKTAKPGSQSNQGFFSNKVSLSGLKQINPLSAKPVSLIT